MSRKKYCIANWKMHKTTGEGVAFVESVKSENLNYIPAKLIVCPVYTSLYSVGKAVDGSAIGMGAQNMHFEAKGAFTGEISSDMLLDCGCEWVILGHSERRHVFGETNETIHNKLTKSFLSGLKPILCIGEKLEERESGRTKAVLTDQLKSAFDGISADGIDNLIIAYEPVWAIGTGKTATIEMVAEAHAQVREIMDDLGYNGSEIPILYGGSVKPGNAGELNAVEGVDGFLIGGAALEPGSYLEIYKSFK